MANVTTDVWRADSVNLSTYAHYIDRVAGREVINGKRQPTWHVPFTQGTPLIWDAPYEAKTITLSIIVSNTDADGNITYAGGGPAHLRENLDTLLGLFSKRGSPIALERDVPNPAGGYDTRTAEVTVIEQVAVGGRRGKQIRQLSVPLYMPWPFWTGGPVTIPTMSPATFEVSGNAPTWPTITFREPGTLILEGTSQYLTADRAGIVVNTREKTAFLDGDPVPALIHPSGREWFPLNPGENRVDGPSVDIEFKPQWH